MENFQNGDLIPFQVPSYPVKQEEFMMPPLLIGYEKRGYDDEDNNSVNSDLIGSLLKSNDPNANESQLSARKYICEKCGKSYIRPDHLKRHMVGHTDNPRPFKCPHEDCPSLGFADNYHLQRHIRQVHINPKRCNHCNVQFLKKD